MPLEICSLLRASSLFFLISSTRSHNSGTDTVSLGIHADPWPSSSQAVLSGQLIHPGNALPITLQSDWLRNNHLLFFSKNNNRTEIITKKEIVILHCISAGAIIGDGDRKSWDARGPMIWDNFSIFRTNRAILTPYIRANPRTCRGFLRGCCHVSGSNVESC